MQIGSSQRTARWQRETKIIISHAGREGKPEQKCRPVRREKSSERVPCAFCRYFEGYKRERGSREGVEEKMLLEKNDILNSCVAASTVAWSHGEAFCLTSSLFPQLDWSRPDVPGMCLKLSLSLCTPPLYIKAHAHTHTVETQCQHTQPLWLIKEAQIEYCTIKDSWEEKTPVIHITENWNLQQNT